MWGVFGFLYIYFLFEKQAFNGLLKVSGIQIYFLEMRKKGYDIKVNLIFCYGLFCHFN